jgi:hypothetical protein
MVALFSRIENHFIKWDVNLASSYYDKGKWKEG